MAIRVLCSFAVIFLVVAVCIAVIFQRFQRNSLIQQRGKQLTQVRQFRRKFIYEKIAYRRMEKESMHILSKKSMLLLMQHNQQNYHKSIPIVREKKTERSKLVYYIIEYI